MPDYLATQKTIMVQRDRDLIPKGLFYAMIGLVVAALLIVSYARLTDQPLTGVPHAAAITDSRLMVLDGDKRTGSVVVRNPDGSVLLPADAALAGFVSVIWRGMDRNRMLQRVTGNPPVDLVQYANGRLSIVDPATGWSAELASFGGLNKAAFARLLDD